MKVWVLGNLQQAKIEFEEDARRKRWDVEEAERKQQIEILNGKLFF